MNYTLVVDGNEQERIHFNIGGIHNVTNSLAAIAAADILGIDRKYATGRSFLLWRSTQTL